MAIRKQIVRGMPLAKYLQAMAGQAVAGNEVEAWSEDNWHCPFCGLEVFVRPKVDPAPHTCHACKGRYFVRMVEGDTFVTSGDDPKQRPGGA